MHTYCESTSSKINISTIFITFFAGEKAEKHRGELRKLLARLTVAQPREPGPWYFYGSLLINNEKRTPEDLGEKIN